MKVGVLGSGDVGKALAAGFLKHGHEVMIGTSHPEKLEEWRKEHSRVQVGNLSEAAGFGEMIVVAVKGTAAKGVIAQVAEHLKGKTVIDTTNPLADQPPENGVLKFFTSLDHSLMEQLQATAPEAHVVKAFNSIGNAFMVNPDFGEKPSMFICGNNEEAKEQVRGILDTFGFEVEDMGSAEAARAIEPLCMLWCIPGFLRNEWTHAFKLLKKS